MNGWLVGLFCILAVVFGIVAGCILEKWRYDRKIRDLNLTLDTVMHGSLSPDWSPYREGELSILVNQLELLVTRTAHMVEQLNSEQAAVHDFIADISHQIKTPLTGLLSYLDLLERAEADAGKKAQLVNCIYLAERMNELLQTLLELARLDAGAVTLHIEDVVAKELVESARQAAAAARPDAGAYFAVDVGEGITLRCDRKWFRQALINVLVNALDHSPDGGMVQITVQQTERVVMVRVFDQGGGIAKAELKDIFKRFHRGKRTKKEGFGIGLAMAESIVRLHKGNLRAENEGNGVAMIFALPLLPCAKKMEGV